MELDNLLKIPKTARNIQSEKVEKVIRTKCSNSHNLTKAVLKLGKKAKKLYCTNITCKKEVEPGKIY